MYLVSTCHLQPQPAKKHVTRTPCCQSLITKVLAHRHLNKKRGSAHRPTARPPAGSTRRVKGRGETGTRVVSSTTDDGFAWRKYGEKIINHHSYRRFYFRCAYRDEHGCGAKKQVQQTQEGPSLFETTYFGKHTHACPRDAPVDLVDSTFVPKMSFLTSSSPGAASHRLYPDDKALQVPSLPAEEEKLILANVAEFTEHCPPVDDRLMKLVPADASFASPAGGRVSLDDSLEELIRLLWS